MYSMASNGVWAFLDFWHIFIKGLNLNLKCVLMGSMLLMCMCCISLGS